MSKIILLLVIPLATLSCLKVSDPINIDVENSFLSGQGAFVVNEGNFRGGNGSLSFFSYDSARLYNNVFMFVNKRPLGDIPYSMTIYGSRAYLVVNNSGKIEVADRYTLISIATINGLISPRYLAAINDVKAYVTSLYSDSVAIVNLETNAITGYIDLGCSSESIITYQSLAFVANWVGGNKVFVINTMNDSLIDSIEVGTEPESMVMDINNYLWVLCNGGWQRENFAELIAINTFGNTIEKRFTFPSINDSPTSLQIDGTGGTLFFLDNGIKRMSIYDNEIPQTPFITPLDRNFYKLGINPSNNEIFVTDVSDYQHKGSLLRYSAQGGLISEYPSEIIPGEIRFKLYSSPYTQ
jgi:DNA-binding beta-propeller fold protein YncE